MINMVAMMPVTVRMLTVLSRVRRTTATAIDLLFPSTHRFHGLRSRE